MTSDNRLTSVLPTDEEDENDLLALTGELLSQAVVFATDWTAETILSQLAKGNISLDPAYQRRDAWRSQNKSRFIESLILVTCPRLFYQTKLEKLS